MTKPNAEQLTACFQDTLYFALGSELTHVTEAAAQASVVYPEHFTSPRSYAAWNTQIQVMEATTFAAAKAYAKNNRVAVLNFANPHYPGGGVANGAMAQEECLCRSSNLFPCLNREPMLTEFYRYHREKTNYFFSDRLIYSPGVTVYKNEDPLPTLLPREEWFQVDVITCAAPYLGQRQYTNKAALKQTLKSRIRNILEAAIDNDVEVLILGAFGCGAFRNPPETVAAAFHEVLQDEGAFQKVIFAIKRAGEPCPNLVAFETEFYGISSERAKLRLIDFGGGIAPDPVLPSGRVLQNIPEKNVYYLWGNQNPYFGKQFSVLGDSISTLEGFNPKGYSVFYQGQTCEQSGVREMKDAWWGKVIDFFRGELLMNDAWSGSRVSGGAFPAGSSRRRTGNLHIHGVMPDVILVYMGLNDWAAGVSVDSGGGNAPDADTFDHSYRAMLSQLRRNYPKAEIWCCTLMRTAMESNPGFVFPESYGGVSIDAYNRAIRAAAGTVEGAKILDLAAMGMRYDSVDGTHPTAKGMGTLATLVARCVADPEGAAILDCPGDSHDYITTATGMEICRRCGALRPGANVSDTPITERLAQPGLVLCSGQDQVIVYQGDRLLAGRSPDCQIRLTSPYAARYQATFIRDRANWFLRDNNSKNGTYINGRKLNPGELVLLHSGDRISFAKREEVTVQ